MQRNAPDAESRYQAVIGRSPRDAGLMMDRARYLRANNYDRSAQQLAAREHHFAYRPADPERFFDMLILLANDAAQDRHWQTAYNIARQIDDVLPAGADVTDQPLAIRDNYTTLAWLGGSIALDRMQPPGERGRDVRPLRARRPLAAGPDQGQLLGGPRRAGAGRFARSERLFPARRRLSRAVLRPARAGAARPVGPAAPAGAAAICDDAAAARRRSTTAGSCRRCGCSQNSSTEQALFVRALAESLDNDADRNLAVELGQQISRQDLAVWTARMARIKGSMLLRPPGLPEPAGARFRAICGRSPTASAGRKARSILMR